MPQGGIDPGEDSWPAALRELREETNITSVQRLGEIAEWLTYDIPREIVGQAWNGKYRGQKQKWFALRFTGDDSEIDIEHPAGGHKPEFVEWRWEELQNLPELVGAVQARASTSAWSPSLRNSPGRAKDSKANAIRAITSSPAAPVGSTVKRDRIATTRQEAIVRPGRQPLVKAPASLCASAACSAFS